MIFLNSAFEPIAPLKNGGAVVWDEQYYGAGKLEITCANIPIGVKYFYNADKKQTGVIESKQKTSNTYTLKGRMLKAILENEIVDEVLNFEGKTPEYIAKALVAKYFPYIKVEENQGLGTPIDLAQSFGEEILEYTDTLLEQQELGATLYYNFETGELTYIVFEGVDNTLEKPLSTNMNNITNVKYLDDNKDYKNYAKVIAEQDDGSLITEIVDVRTSDTEEIKTLYVNGNSVSSKDITTAQYRDALRQKGMEKLDKLKRDTEIYFDPLIPLALGEKRQFVSDDIEATQRVTRIITGYEDGTVQQSVTFGNQQITDIEKLRNEVL